MAAAEPGRAAAAAWIAASAGLTLAAMTAAVRLAPPVTARPDTALSWLLFTGSSAHVASTGWMFTLPEVRAHAARRRGRYLWAPLVLTAAAALAAAAVPARAFAPLLLPYFAWQFHHFSKQNLGLAALSAGALGAPALSPGERRALLASGWAGIAGLMARPALLGAGLNLPWLAGAGPLAQAASVAFALAGTGFAGAVVAGLALHCKRPADGRSGGLSVMYGAALLFWLPVFLFSSPYAAVGGMTVAHGLQYLLLIALIAAGRPGGGPGRLAAAGLLGNIALIGGAVLSVASHLHAAGPPGRLLFGAYLGVVMSHFVIDAGLWRMREEFPRRFLARHLPYLVPASTGRRAHTLIPASDPSVTDIRCDA